MDTASGGIMAGFASRKISRRDWLQIGGAGLAGLTLTTLLRAETDAEQQGQPSARAKNVIFIWQQGGPPHQDTFDMKPNAPSNMRGEFNPVPTSIPGYTVCELLPQLSQMVHHFTILRGVNHNIADHNPGSMYM